MMQVGAVTVAGEFTQDSRAAAERMHFGFEHHECGSFTKHGTWYYAASRQRYGCGSHVRIEANGHCVVAQTDDYGPDVCVENAAGGAVIDASPLVARHLFGVSSAGWSEHRRTKVTVVSRSTR